MAVIACARRTAVAAALAVGMFIAAGSAAAAAPDSPTAAPAAQSSASSAPDASAPDASAPDASAPDTSAPDTSASATSSGSEQRRKPAVTAPPAPNDYGPQCPTNAAALYPAVCLPKGSGEDMAASVTAGDEFAFAAQVVNNGPAVSDAEVAITLPAGLQLESDEGDAVFRIDHWYDGNANKDDFTALTCHADGSTITCSVGALAMHANILIFLDLQVSRTAEPGSALTFGVALQPVGLPTYPSTSVQATVDVLAPGHLVVSLTPATLHTEVGHRATMTGIVHNAGSGAAPGVFAIAVTADVKHPKRTHFTITNSTKLTDPTGGGSSDSAAPTAGGGETSVLVVDDRSASPLRAQLQRRTLSKHADSVRRHVVPSFGFWPLGTIAPGATKTVSIKLKARSVGTDSLIFGAISDADTSDCDEDESGSGSESGSVSAIPMDRAPAAAATTTAPAACSLAVRTHITVIPAAAALADTGNQHLEVELGVALWALVLGSLCVWAGRRRITRRHG